MRLPYVVLLAASCAMPLERSQIDDDLIDGATSAFPDFESSPEASPRLQTSDLPDDIGARIDGWFAGHGSQRMHVQLDRPLYRPGDTVWVKSWSVVTRGLSQSGQTSMTYELVDPRGLVVETKRVSQEGGDATNDFVLKPGVAGGKWMIRATLPTGEVDERPFVVSSYEIPRIRKRLEFVREAYGAGDRVEALVELERTTGGPLSDHTVRAILQVAGEIVLETDLRTDKTGAAFLSADLPRDLASSDGLLTVLVEDGGITESISRSVPIVLGDAKLAFFPEGGDLVEDLPGRVYFSATDAHGEPADVSGFVTDDRGDEVAEFTSVHDGLGRVAYTPEPGRTYSARITSPPGIDQVFELPSARAEGCTLRSFDDVRSEQSDVRIAVRCSSDDEVLVSGVLREQTLDVAAVHAGPDKDTVVHLSPGDDRALEQGAVRVTVFDRALVPLAERLVYRNPGRDLQIEVTADRGSYGPRDEVVVRVNTADASGQPIAAEVAVAVVDDGVITLADDEEGHILSRLYLEPELVDSPEDPGWYFDREEVLAARGLDLVMGTKGYRRFEWRPVWEPEVVAVTNTTRRSVNTMDDFGMAEAEPMEGAVPQPLPEPKPEPEPMPRAVPVPDVLPIPVAAADPPPMPPVAVVEETASREDGEEAWNDMPVAKPEARQLGGNRNMLAARDLDLAQGRVHDGLLEMGYFGGFRGDIALEQLAFAVVRVFPAPDYSGGFTGTRTDFRDTVHWEPTVTTDERGQSEFRFYLSDAVTTFRLTAEGVGAGLAGHAETTLESVLPVSIATKLPPAVSAGDTLLLPLTATNTRDQPLSVDVMGTFDSELIVVSDTHGELTLEPGGSATHWIPLQIGDGAETATLHLSAEGGGLSDAFERELVIVPPGFPRSWSASGEHDGRTELGVQLDEWVQGSLTASVSWHPSTVSSLMAGMAGLIQTPGGCFEQTSSTNWPNVAILSYLEAHDGDPRLRLQSSHALDAGYAKLTGYQVSAGGFETWGSGPGKEALSAFGLLQFADMQKVYPVADSVLAKDAKYLLDQRDGRGGFKNSGESAHGYGSAPKPVLDGFITWALVQTGYAAKLQDEIAHQTVVARESDDPYVLALAVRSLIAVRHPGAESAVKRLAAMQAVDGSFPGAESSITRSYEANLVVESTALASLALMASGAHRAGADKAVQWLIDNRRGVGTWGATQATALALSSLTTHAELNRRPQIGGRLALEVNGTRVGSLAYSADHSEALLIEGWQDALAPGDNVVVLVQEAGEPMPYTVDISWTSITPKTSPGAELNLVTELSDTDLTMGDTVRLTANVQNVAGRLVPSPIARIGLPAGLEAQTWQLEQLQERGEIAFFETRPREVTLYWDGLHEDDSHEVKLDLVAAVPGSFTGPASSAYPYYNDDEMAWAGGLKVEIGR